MPKTYAEQFRKSLNGQSKALFGYRTKAQAQKIRIAAYRFASRNNTKAKTCKFPKSKVVAVWFEKQEAV